MKKAVVLLALFTALAALSLTACSSGPAPTAAPEEPSAAPEEPTSAPPTPTPTPTAPEEEEVSPTPTPLPPEEEEEEEEAPTPAPLPPLEISSSAFENQGEIPPQNALCPDPVNLSPALSWSNVPPDTQSLALVCVDTDADFVHWVIHNIPPAATGLPEGVPSDAELDDGSLQGTSDYGELGYGGPCPPPGETHTYVFTLYALDTMLDVPAGADADTVLQAAQGRILAEASVTGLYQW